MWALAPPAERFVLRLAQRGGQCQRGGASLIDGPADLGPQTELEKASHADSIEAINDTADTWTLVRVSVDAPEYEFLPDWEGNVVNICLSSEWR